MTCGCGGMRLDYGEFVIIFQKAAKKLRSLELKNDASR